MLTEVDVVLTVRNITAKAFDNGDGTGVDYRTLLTERYFVPLLGLQPNATWSDPIDGQREASVTFGPAKDLPKRGRPYDLPKTALEASIRVVGSAGAGDAVVASVERVINNTKYPANLLPAVTLVSIDPPTISVRPLAAPSPPPTPPPPSPPPPVDCQNYEDNKCNMRDDDCEKPKRKDTKRCEKKCRKDRGRKKPRCQKTCCELAELGFKV